VGCRWIEIPAGWPPATKSACADWNPATALGYKQKRL